VALPLQLAVLVLSAAAEDRRAKWRPERHPEKRRRHFARGVVEITPAAWWRGRGSEESCKVGRRRQWRSHLDLVDRVGIIEVEPGPGFLRPTFDRAGLLNHDLCGPNGSY
jgi:hypothetical protein